MCGIYGFSSLTETTRKMQPALSLLMSQRGTDSWGATNGIEFHKSGKSILDTFVPFEAEGPQVYHTRAASAGFSISEATAHPFQFEGERGRVIGVHNGHVNNWQALNTKYSRNFAVDSMHIFAHLAEGKPLSDIGGWGTIVWWEQLPDEPTPRGPFFSGWGSVNLAVGQLLSGEIVWASTELAVRTAAQLAGAELYDFWLIKPKHKYILGAYENGDLCLFDDGPLSWDEAPVKSAATQYVYRGSYTPLINQALLCRAQLGCRNTVTTQGDYSCGSCISKVASLLGIFWTKKAQVSNG